MPELPDYVVVTDYFVSSGYEPAVVKKSKKIIKEDLSADPTVASIFDIGAPDQLSYRVIQQFLSAYPELAKFLPTNNVSKTLVGIEVEVENVLRIDQNIPLVFWRVAEDGSLRNNGREFKTVAIPSFIAPVVLHQLFNGLNDTIDFSRRTSIHVHLDARQLSPQQLTGLLFTYLCVENVLFKFADLSRRSNIFCVPLQESNLVYDMKPMDLRSYTNIVDRWHKYTALNLLTLAQFGTLEFRHLPGTNNVEKIITWIRLLTKLKIFAYRNSLDDIVSLICNLNTSSGYLKFLEGVFGSDVVYLDTTSLLNDMEKAVTTVKNSAIANPFHANLFTKETSVIVPSQIDKWRIVMPRLWSAVPGSDYHLLDELSKVFGWKPPLNYQVAYKQIVVHYKDYLDHSSISVGDKEKLQHLFFGET